MSFSFTRTSQSPLASSASSTTTPPSFTARLEPGPAQGQTLQEDEEDKDRSLELAEGQYGPNYEFDDDEDCAAQQSSALLPTNWPQSPRKPARNMRAYSLHDSCIACFRSAAKRSRNGPRKGRLLLVCITAVLVTLGLVQFVTLTLGAFASFFPSDIEKVIARWGNPGQLGEYLSHWPTDTTGGVIPIPCHSHNDYWRPVPLYSALEAGCVSVEADIWLFDNELFVGHTTGSLTPNRTLTKLYIDPLVEILEKQNPISRFHPKPNKPPNGVFDTKPSQTLILLIDFKNKAVDAWPYLLSQLSPLRDRGYLSYFNGTGVTEGPVTVVATGKASFSTLSANDTYRDVFFDAPLDALEKDTALGNTKQPSNLNLPDGNDKNSDFDEMYLIRSRHYLQNRRPKQSTPQRFEVPPIRTYRNEEALKAYTYNPNNSYYASVSFKKSIGFPWRFHLTGRQLDLLRAQVHSAHQRGLKARYWSIPSWPRSLRNHLWTVLIREGVDILNVDDLKSAARRDWSESRLWRWKQ
ncbi:hypothetical protein AJ78_00561 [Emergomyces pasteurianus Ep9510]|uniref:Altered inheritance of mitochondria protein 6 n=1 Tax=Emergomyces pasteurianus Ep9510 TaxID=1447872 RepID=A0A1J9QUE9_9EURO|nr:hypothetical protein AJ78_00561 [Emergomyces pasteurianus Ep9510]